MPLHPPIDSIALEADPRVTVARVELGLTLYLADARAWAQGGAAAALRAVLAAVDPARMCFFTTSRLGEWRLSSADTHARLLEALAAPALEGRPRHLLHVQLADDRHVPCAGFSYREVDPARAARAGVLEVTLPQEEDPQRLLGLARALAACGTVFSGVGGYVVRHNPALRRLAFERAHAWCQRYWGLDVQDAEATAWHAPHGLPGSNWLTLVGPPLLDAHLAALGKPPPDFTEKGVQLERVGTTLLVRAGAAPTVADMNQLALPAAYTAAARWLAPAFLREAPRLPGTFAHDDAAGAWFRRLVDGRDWAR